MRMTNIRDSKFSMFSNFLFTSYTAQKQNITNTSRNSPGRLVKITRRQPVAINGKQNYEYWSHTSYIQSQKSRSLL